MILSKHLSISILLVLFSTIWTYSQEIDDQLNESTNNDDPTKIEQGEEGIDDTDVRPLKNLDFLRRDIAALNTVEMQEWLSSLGISIEGNDSVLRNRLFEYYKIDPEQEQLTEQGPLDEMEQEDEPSTTISIISARYSRYETVHDEELFLLSGNVHVKIEDLKSQVVHELKADELTINVTQDILTAKGNIWYLLDEEEQQEQNIFQGDSLIFYIDNWDGVFLGGSGSREVEREDSGLNVFYFTGEQIIRTKGDVVVIENAIITSSDRRLPNYSFRADKAVILAPGEWQINSVWIYIGEVPLFYLPFFFNPSREMVLHPNVGYDQKLGAFIQTTTYLLGQSPADQSPISILQYTENETQSSLQKPDGLFMKATGEPAPPDLPLLKLYVDYYTIRGPFLGLDGTFDSLHFFLGMAYTWHVQPSSSYSTFYTREFLDSSNASRLYTSNAWIFSGEIPFRFGIDFSTEFGFDQFSGDIELSLYTDPYFYNDYLLRQDQIDWSRLLGLEEESTSSTVSDYSETNILWQMSWNPLVDSLNPLITQFNISDLRLNWAFKSSQTPTASMDSVLSSSVNSSEYNFFVPDVLTLPRVGINIAGEIFKLESSSSIVQTQVMEESSNSIDFIPSNAIPSNSNDQEKNEESNEDTLLVPSMKNKELEQSPFPTSFWNLKYSIGTIEIQNIGVYSNLSTEVSPLNANYEPEYFSFYHINDINLESTISLSDALVVLSFPINFNYRIQNSYGFISGYSSSSKDSLLSLDAQTYKVDLSQNLGFTFNFFNNVPHWENSLFQYNLDFIYFQQRASYSSGSTSYSENLLQWNTSFIQRHDLTLNFQMNANGFSQSINNSFEISPYTPSWDLAYRLGYAKQGFNLGFSATWGIKEDQSKSNGIGYDNLVINFKLFPTESIGLTQNYTFNDELSYLQSLTSNLSLFFITFSLNSIYGDIYRLSSGKTSWEDSNSNGFFINNLTLNITPEFEKLVLWKNRITLTPTLSFNWNHNPQQFTNSVLSVQFGIDFNIYEFLDIQLSVKSSNTRMYRYFEYYADQLAVSQLNFFTDLIKGFNIFDVNDLRESNFNLDSVSMNIIHDLEDWVLDISYTGKPELVSISSTESQYEWDSTFTVLLQWKAIPELKQDYTYDEGVFDIE